MLQSTKKMNPADMQKNAAQATILLKSMANETRLLILCQLAGSEKSVGDLLRSITLSQSALSQHLAILRRERLVSTRRSAQTVYYTLASDEVMAIMGTLYNLYCGEGEKTSAPALELLTAS